MAQVTWNGDRATIWFDESEMVIVNESNRRGADFLQNAVVELLAALARKYNDEIMREKISEIRQGNIPGRFGRLNEMRLA